MDAILHSSHGAVAAALRSFITRIESSLLGQLAKVRQPAR
jgi:hypothetical protein